TQQLSLRVPDLHAVPVRLRNDLDPGIERFRAPIRGIETSARYGRCVGHPPAALLRGLLGALDLHHRRSYVFGMQDASKPETAAELGGRVAHPNPQVGRWLERRGFEAADRADLASGRFWGGRCGA